MLQAIDDSLRFLFGGLLQSMDLPIFCHQRGTGEGANGGQSSLKSQSKGKGCAVRDVYVFSLFFSLFVPARPP